MEQPIEQRTDERPGRSGSEDPPVKGVVDEKRPGTASGLTCPECQGSIWEIRDGESVRFECRFSHAYGADAFVAQQGERVEMALWTAVNTIRERSETFHRLAELYGPSSRMGERYRERAEEMTQQADVIRDLLYRLANAGDVG